MLSLIQFRGLYKDVVQRLVQRCCTKACTKMCAPAGKNRLLYPFYLVDPSVIIHWISPPINSRAFGLVDVYQFVFILRSNVFLFYANSVYVGQMARFAASDMGLDCLPVTLLWDTR